MYEFKKGRKAANNQEFDLNTVNEDTMVICSIFFRSGDKNFVDKEHGNRPLEVDNDELKTLFEANKTTREVA